MMCFAERVRNKSTDSAGIRTQDLLSTSQTLSPLSHLDGPLTGAEDKLHKQHCLEASAKFQLILLLSTLDPDFFPWIYFSLSPQKHHS